jgi:hypothetical protein
VGTVLQHSQSSDRSGGRVALAEGVRVGLAVANLLPEPSTVDLQSLVASAGVDVTLVKAHWTTTAVVRKRFLERVF